MHFFKVFFKYVISIYTLVLVLKFEILKTVILFKDQQVISRVKMDVIYCTYFKKPPFSSKRFTIKIVKMHPFHFFEVFKKY